MLIAFLFLSSWFYGWFQYSCLGNRIDRGGWLEAAVHGVVESDMTEQLNQNQGKQKLNGSSWLDLMWEICGICCFSMTSGGKTCEFFKHWN